MRGKNNSKPMSMKNKLPAQMDIITGTRLKMKDANPRLLMNKIKNNRVDDVVTAGLLNIRIKGVRVNSKNMLPGRRLNDKV